MEAKYILFMWRVDKTGENELQTKKKKLVL